MLLRPQTSALFLAFFVTAACRVSASAPADLALAPADSTSRHVSGGSFLSWARDHAVEFDTLDWRLVDAGKFAALDRLLEGKRVVYLGEPDHYVREKNDFRLIFIRYLFLQGWRHIGMEMGRSDAKRVDRYLQTGDRAYLDRVASLGYTGDERGDRRHTLKGINRDVNPEFWDRTWAEHRWFLQQLRSLNEELPDDAPHLRWFGYDVDTRPGGAYTDAEALLKPHRSQPLAGEIMRRMARVDGESRAEEIDRLEHLLSYIESNKTRLRTFLGVDDARDLRRTLRCMTDGYTFLLGAVDGLGSPEGMAALRLREERMFQHMDRKLAELAPTDKIILMGHNMHLSKDSSTLLYGPVGSGAPEMWRSIGTHVAERLPGQVCAIWMLFDHGHHAKLMRDTIIEKEVTSSPYVIEHILAKAGATYFLPFHTGDAREAYLEQPRNFNMNGRPIGGIVKNQADAIFFVAEVHTPSWRRGEG